jgi:hypothetical protein
MKKYADSCALQKLQEVKSLDPQRQLTKIQNLKSKIQNLEEVHATSR